MNQYDGKDIGILPDVELLRRIRAGELGEFAARWIEDLKDALVIAHEQAMANGQLARQLQIEIDEWKQT